MTDARRPNRPDSADPAPVPREAWTGLASAVIGQAAATVAIIGPGFLIPMLTHAGGMSLGQAGLVAAAPTLGVLLTLILWGALADRHGERIVICSGLGLVVAAAAVGWALTAGGGSLLTAGCALIAAGAAAASVNTATGRVVVGWFPRRRRGLAMGIRQMSQPLGVALAAVTVPPIADAFGLPGFFAFAGGCALFACLTCLLGIVDPPRAAEPVPVAAGEPAEAGSSAAAGAPGPAAPVRPANPYRADSFLTRIHAVSALLVIPQSALATYGLVWLIAGVGMGAAAAGVVVGAAQLVGAFGRVAMGWVSDAAPTRVGVLRLTAVAAAAAMLAVAGCAVLGWPALAAVVFVIASTISVADNGLAFTSVAEAAGPRWSGRALGVQNTGQFATTTALTPLIGVVIDALGYPGAFAILTLAPVVAVALVPRADVQRVF